MRETAIFAFWHGRALSPLEEACLRSFVDNGHKVHLFSYTDFSVPAGVTLECAEDILHSDEFFLFDGSPSGFTDLFRYKLLYDKGGWWVDTDVLCFTRSLPTCEYYWACEVPGRVNGAVLRFPPHDSRCGALLRRTQEICRNQKKVLASWGQIGPDLLTQVLAQDSPPGLRGSTSETYPIHWLEAHLVFLPEYFHEVEARVKSSTFLHLWNSIFSRMGIDVNCSPPPGSYLNAVYRNYGVRANPGNPMDRAQITRYLDNETFRSYYKQHFGRDLNSLLPNAGAALA